jgi:CheY-like chemotaxis protein
MRETFPRDIDIVSDVPVDLAMIDGDRTQIHQVLMNLCVNARDAMPNGGILTVSAENTHVDDDLAAAHVGARTGAHIAIHVKDSGTGIPREHLDKIFDPFFTTKPLGKGTGLGLATVLGIVRSHGGLVTVVNTPGAGAEFVVSIPARAPAVESVAVDPDRANLRGHNELVVVIDDEASIRAALSSTLKLYGYRVLTAADGAAGTAVYFEHAQDVRLVITDIMMPVMDGMQAIRAIRRLNPALPIIAMSGVPTQRIELETTYGPHLRFLPKPFLIEKVLALTHALLAAAPPSPPAPARL